MSPAWTTVRVRHPENRAAVITALFAAGAESVQELDDEVVTHLRDANGSRVSEAVRRADPDAIVEYAPTPDVDWSKEWRGRIRAHRIGRLVITPPWLADGFGEDERVVIEPEMAFGTGEHETTRAVIRVLQRFLKQGATVVDLGAGSAVLSIAAAKLGARRAIAIELDAEAIPNAEANVRANGATERVTVLHGDAALLLPLVAPCDLVLANIISSVLLELLPTIEASLDPDGVAILSGILVEERMTLETAVSRTGWRILESDEDGIWWTAAIGR